MRRTRQGGFSVVEMLVVLGIILVLLALLMAPLMTQATRSSYTASCGSNLNQIAMARVAFKNDSNRSLGAGEWATLNQYFVGDKASRINTQSGVLRCPEDAELAGGVADSFRIGIATRNPKTDTNISYYIDFAISPLNVHMSQEQYDRVVWSGQEGKDFFARNPWYTGYEPGSNPDLYYVIFEDIHFKVEVVGDETKITARRGQAGYRHFLFDSHGNNLLGSGVAIPTSWVTVQVPMGPSSYGMNLYTQEVEDGSGKIFAIDYEATIVKPETWSRWDDANGIPKFARHKSRQLNALWYDGSVHQMDHAEINPEFVSNDMLYWQP